MGFLSPFVLFGLAAAAIPLIIHLFNFRRPKRVDFSSLVFVRELEKQTVRRMRLKQWLLLSLRMLSIACLVLAFARPIQSSEGTGVLGERSPSAIAVVVDNSMSMTMRDAQGTYLSQTQGLASTIFEGAFPGDELFLIRTAESAEAGPLGQLSRGAGLDLISELQAGAKADALTATISRAASLLEQASNPVKELVVISDLQASTFSDSTLATISDEIDVTLMPVGNRNHANTAVTDVQIVSRIVEPGRPIQLSAFVKRFGGDADDIVASVFVEGERVAHSSFSLRDREEENVSFTFTPSRRGWLRGEVRLEPDDAEWDDVRYFALNVPDEQRVLLTRSDGARSDLVALALNVASEGGSLRTTQRDEGGLMSASLSDFDAVALVGVEDLSPGQSVLLERYVAQGGGLLLFVGERLEAANTLLRALGGGRFEGFIGEPEGPSIGGFGSADLEHPLFHGLFDESGGSLQLESPDIFRAGRYAAGGRDESTVITLAGGLPFLQEIRHGRGLVLVFTVAPDPRWTDFATRGLFAPLLYRSMVFLASGSGLESGYDETSLPDLIRLDGITDSQPIRVVDQQGQEWTPAQRTVPGGVVLELAESIAAPGLYDVMHGERLLRRFAVNTDSRESDLMVLSAAEAVNQLDSLTGRRARLLNASGGVGVAAAEQMRSRHSGIDIANVFLALALAFLVAEMLVAMRWRAMPTAGA